jgi:leucyl-tRNA synthetase
MREIPEDAVQAVAEKLYRAYDSEYGADHLTWRNFADQARELIEPAAPHLAEHIAARLVCPYAGEQPGHPCDYEDAARIARETFPPTRTPGHPNATPTGDPT